MTPPSFAALLILCVACGASESTPTPPEPAPVIARQPQDPGLPPLTPFEGLALGADAQTVEAALGQGADGSPMPGSTCYYLSAPSRSERFFMMNEGRLARIDVRDRTAAPGGGRVGMSPDAIRELYGPSVASSPHAYSVDGEYLRIDATSGEGALLFEVVDGAVTSWRIGLDPEVGWVEGCS